MKTERITGAFVVEELPTTRQGRVEVVLKVAIEYHVGSPESGEVIIVPEGFVTDFASIPRGLWNIFPPLGPWARAAIVHDYLYSTAGLYGRYTRKRCDDIFVEIMKILKVAAWKRTCMYYAVRAFGHLGWGLRS